MPLKWARVHSCGGAIPIHVFVFDSGGWAGKLEPGPFGPPLGPPHRARQPLRRLVLENELIEPVADADADDSDEAEQSQGGVAWPRGAILTAFKGESRPSPCVLVASCSRVARLLPWRHCVRIPARPDCGNTLWQDSRLAERRKSATH